MPQTNAEFTKDKDRHQSTLIIYKDPFHNLP